MRNPFVPPQRNRAEMLDLGRGSLSEVRRSLHDIRRINTYLGGTRLTIDGVLALLQERDLKQATVLDVGSGLADIPARLQAAGARRGIDIRAIALDNNCRHLHIAREELGGGKVLLCGGNAFHLPLPDRSVDVVMSSLLLHHFRARQIAALLHEFARVARVGFVMNDQVRASVPLAFFRATGPIFARSYLTRLDGAASIRRAYTVVEMAHLVAQHGPSGARVRAHFPYRLSVTWRRDA